ncbi:hypothetical protein IJJ08_02960 [bacterium]|nr:hypothetical protein [bacterium]
MWQKWWQQSGKWVLALVLFWQATILGTSFVVTTFEPFGYQPSYPLFQLLEQLPLPAFVARLGGFDGVHYQTIINHQGYKEIGGIQAFFPLYPLVIWLFNFLTHQTVISGLLISSLSLFGFIALGQWWLQEKYDTRLSWWWVGVTLCLPGSFFYLTVYTESLFLFLLVALFYAYDHRRYAWVGVLGILLSACRIVGIIAVAALCLDYLYHAWKSQHMYRWETLKSVLLIALGGAGLVTYMSYLYLQFGDPLMFAHVQADFGAGRDAVHLVALPQVFWRYLKMCLGGFSSLFEGYRILQELLMSGFYLVGLLAVSWWGWQQKKPLLPWYLLLFSWGAYLLGPLTGNFQSMTRYTLVCLSVHVLVAHYFQRKKVVGLTLAAISAVINLVNLMLFIEGIFVA